MKAFITVIGRDKVGIIAEVSNLLAERGVNIEDISQTILQGMFTMIMACDISDESSFGELKGALQESGDKLGVEISVRHADIFNAMHRI